MTVREVTGTVINEKMDKGWGYTQLAEFLDCTVAELKHELFETERFNRRARREFKTRMDQYEKTYQRSKKRSKKTTSSDTVQTPPEDELAEPDTTSRIDELKSQIETATSRLNHIEQGLKKIAAEGICIKNKLRPLETELAQLEKKMNRVSHNIGDLNHELEINDSERIALEKARDAEQSHLADLETELDRLNVIAIYVEHGAITNDSGDVITAPDDWHTKFVELRDTEAAEDFTIKEIKLVAQIVTIVTAYERYHLLVDSEHLVALLALNGVECIS